MSNKNIFLSKSAICACIALSFGVLGAQEATARPGGYAGAIRAIPEDSYMGLATFLRIDVVQIEGQSFALAPGIMIRDEHNMMVLPMQIINYPAGRMVRFKLNSMGMIDRMWLLRDDELQSMQQ